MLAVRTVQLELLIHRLDRPFLDARLVLLEPTLQRLQQRVDLIATLAQKGNTYMMLLGNQHAPAAPLDFNLLLDLSPLLTLLLLHV